MPFKPEKIFREQLAVAEKRFGKRTGSYKLQVRARANPTPEAVLPPGSDTVFIYHFDQILHDGQRLIVQLSHEAIHVVAGGFKRQARVFEEGWAVDFSLSRVSQSYKNLVLSDPMFPPLFRDAFEKFRDLNATDAAIRRLRQSCFVDDINPAILQEVFGAESSLAAALCERVSARDEDRTVT